MQEEEEGKKAKAPAFKQFIEKYNSYFEYTITDREADSPRTLNYEDYKSESRHIKINEIAYAEGRKEKKLPEQARYTITKSFDNDVNKITAALTKVSLVINNKEDEKNKDLANKIAGKLFNDYLTNNFHYRTQHKNEKDLTILDKITKGYHTLAEYMPPSVLPQTDVNLSKQKFIMTLAFLDVLTENNIADKNEIGKTIEKIQGKSKRIREKRMFVPKAHNLIDQPSGKLERTLDEIIAKFDILPTKETAPALILIQEICEIFKSLVNTIKDLKNSCTLFRNKPKTSEEDDAFNNIIAVAESEFRGSGFKE